MTDTTIAYHEPVLLCETIAALAIRPHGAYVDGTLGGGGHFRAIIEKLGARGTAVGIDRDPEAVAWNAGRIPPTPARVIIEQQEFSRFDAALSRHGIGAVDGMLLDLGISSHQIDNAARGFSYLQECDLDMRMDPGIGARAADLLNDATEEQLAEILETFGEIINPRRMARAFVRFRAVKRFGTSADLRECLAREYGPNVKFKVLSKVFQALRIAVNNELDELTACLEKTAGCLREKGRLAVIAYHSLEDRIVKNFMREKERHCACPPEQPICTCDRHPIFNRINNKAIKAGEAEIARNPRARSARLRVAERTENSA
jgi:16S rRNA (cytosine1402-N4)-methyltransferase